VLGIGVLILRDNERLLLFRLVSPVGSGVIGQIGFALLAIGAFGVLTSILGCSAASRKCSIGWASLRFLLKTAGKVSCPGLIRTDS